MSQIDAHRIRRDRRRDSAAYFAQCLANVPVTVDNFIRAESDTYIRQFRQGERRLAKLLHRREPASIDNQTVIRLNRDTLYSVPPCSISMPDR